MTQSNEKLADVLLPCPFCGGEVELVKDHTTEGTDWIRHIRGAVCGIEDFSNFGAIGDVSTLWNTRAKDDLAETGIPVTEQNCAPQADLADGEGENLTGCAGIGKVYAPFDKPTPQANKTALEALNLLALAAAPYNEVMTAVRTIRNALKGTA